MTTSTFKVGNLLSSLGARGIEKQLKHVTGVGRVAVNPVSGATTVVYDPAKTGLPAIEAAIKECGYHCAGEALPNHLCENHPASKTPETALAIKGKAKPVDAHTGMAMPMPSVGKPDPNADPKAHAGARTATDYCTTWITQNDC